MKAESMSEPTMPKRDFPEAHPEEYGRLQAALGRGHPLFMIDRECAGESEPDEGGIANPTGERNFFPLPHVVRKHRDRAVVLATYECFSYCRFCFRRERVGRRENPDDHCRNLIYEWIRSEEELREIILSGGDPLTLGDEVLGNMAASLGAIAHLEKLRVHTRAVVTNPARITGELVSALSSGPPAEVIIHTAHPDEVRPEMEKVVGKLLASGFKVLNQTVLLAGVNDDPATLGRLFGSLCELGVKTKYLHHPDRAPGNKRFRVSIKRGLEIHSLLAHDDSGRKIKTPAYVLDLPNGAGKCPVAELAPLEHKAVNGSEFVKYRWSKAEGFDSLSGDDEYEWWDIAEQPPIV